MIFKIIFLFWEMHAEISRYVIMKSIPSVIISVWYFKWENVNSC